MVSNVSKLVKSVIYAKVAGYFILKIVINYKYGVQNFPVLVKVKFYKSFDKNFANRI